MVRGQQKSAYYRPTQNIESTSRGLISDHLTELLIKDHLNEFIKITNQTPAYPSNRKFTSSE